MTSTLTTDRLLRDLWTPRPLAGAVAAPVAAADVYQSGDDLVARFDLPGVDPAEDVTVEVEGRKLVVRGERKDQRAAVEAESTEAAPTRRLREVRFGEFRRVVTLPRTAEADAVTATYDAGVLTVTVVGVYAGRTPQKIEITTAAA